jgi:aminoglycoside 6'-N-acetyltransferase
MDLTFRALDRADLPRLGQWIAASHVQPWWREPADPASVEAAYGPAIDGPDPTELFVVQLDGRPIGFIQRCLLRDNSDYGEALSRAGTDPDAATIDYLIGDPTLVGQGLGTQLIATFVADTWVRHPDVDSIVVAVQQDNVASWRVLEKSGFRRVWSGVVDSGHPSDDGDSHVYELSRVAYGIPRNDQQP